MVSDMTMTNAATNVGRLAKRGSFWAAASVLALCLWSSGAPSVLYPSYAAQWHLPPVVVTSIFGTYPVALLIVLLLFGGLSDTIGRRRSMMLGVGLILASAVVFAIAPNVGFLFFGRALQGVGTALALGAASAALVENNTSKNPRVASLMTTASTAAGLTLVLFVSGALAQYAPLPEQLSYWVLAVLGAATLAFVWRMPSDTHLAKGGRWKPSGIHVPRSLVRVFIASTLSVSVAYSVGAIMLSLGAQMARELTGTTNLLVVGALLAVSSFAIGVTALMLQKVPGHVSILVGVVVSILGLGIMELTVAFDSIALFLVWCVVAGIGYSFAFTGGLTLLNRTAPAEHRGGMLSMLYLFSYLFQAVTAIVAGALATAFGLGLSIDYVAPGVVVLSLVTGIITLIDLVARRRVEKLEKLVEVGPGLVQAQPQIGTEPVEILN
jgi:MFS family permease